MKNLYIILFSLISFSIYAQNANTKHMLIFDDCQLEDLKTRADKAPSFMGGIAELNNYFTNECNNNGQHTTLEGKVFIQVLIDSSGHPCCRQIANKTGEDLAELQIKRVINEMPVWSAAVINGKKHNFSAFLILTFSNGKCKVTYNKSEGVKVKKEYNIPCYSMEEALTHIERTRNLNLSNKGLKEVNPEIGKLVNLTELNLAQNHLKKLPEEIGQLTKLEFLYLSSNQLESLPKEICKLINLKGLLINKNQLKSLPKDIGKLKNLRMLNVSDNKITDKDVEKLKILLPDCKIIK